MAEHDGGHRQGVDSANQEKLPGSARRHGTDSAR